MSLPVYSLSSLFLPGPCLRPADFCFRFYREREDSAKGGSLI
ncbi:hypothetical protein HMPREF3039_01718 [Akkermansia sp. KLE1798]|nr:hypothetical protein HMPREF3039_01718 [Akkermansia sp. KLE1798]KZA05535.1 hypothetical protein HMPREF1326_00710 [Akkermansia sp. KLE1605]